MRTIVEVGAARVEVEVVRFQFKLQGGSTLGLRLVEIRLLQNTTLEEVTNVPGRARAGQALLWIRALISGPGRILIFSGPGRAEP